MTEATLLRQGSGGATAPPVTLSRLAGLAWPIVLSRAGILIMAFVDIVMLGRLSAAAVAEAALGMSIFIPVLVTGIGLLQGVLVLSAQARGRGDGAVAWAVFQRGLPWSIALGIAGAGLVALSPLWFGLLGQDPALAERAGLVAMVVAVGLPANLVFIVAAFALEAAERPTSVLLAMIGANLLNAALNWVLIFGHWGAPELGSVGSGIATSASRFFMAAAVLAVLWRIGAFQRAADDRGRLWGPGGWAGGAPMRRLGAAAGVAMMMETSFFATLTLLAGRLGETPLASFSILLNFQSILFMASVGLGAATAVMVGAAFGAGDRAGVRKAARLGVWAVVGVMAIGGGIAALAPEAVARLYTDADPLAAATAALFGLLAVVLIFDGAQMVMSLAVRALGDAWAATRLFVIAYWCVGAPAAMVLTGAYGWGVPGLLIAALAGSVVSFTLQSWRFAALVRRDDH